MKVIPENTISSLAMTNGDTNFPVANALDVHPRFKAKATGSSSVLTFDIAAGANAGAIFGTNADTALVSVSNANNVDWVGGSGWVGGASWLSQQVDVNFSVLQNGASMALFWEHESAGSSLKGTITLSSPSATVLEFGIIVSGEMVDLGGIAYGITESTVDYSPESVKKNGARYYKPRYMARKFDFSMRVERETGFYRFMNILRDYGRVEMAWKLTDLKSTNWIVFGYFEDMPDGVHDAPNNSSVTGKIIEAI